VPPFADQCIPADRNDKEADILKRAPVVA
jgi:hypothetical protein